MSDPLDVLRTPAVPVDPDPVFAARLRARLQRVLDLPKGVTVVDLALQDRPAAVRTPSVLTPYLAVVGAPAALEWYGRVLGARPRGEPIVMPDGRIGHAELDVGGAVLMLSEEHPEIGVVAPAPGTGVPVTVHLTVPDVDRVVAGAVAAGAELERPPTDAPYGRSGVIRDPFGHRWMIMTPAPDPDEAQTPTWAGRASAAGSRRPRAGSGEAATAGRPAAASGRPAAAASRAGGAGGTGGLRHGDIGYVSLWVPDVTRAASFFGTVLEWRYAPGSAPQGRQVEGTNGPHHGLWGGQARSTLFLCLAVDDVVGAAERVRAAGGTAAAPHVEPYGTIVECTDDQGTAFAVFEPPGGVVGADPSAPGGDTPSDLAYVTMEVVDSARARAFYGSVLGWRFSPGRVADGWQVTPVTPLVGISGGHDEATTLPMYRVSDIEAAVSRVRGAGGSATDPEEQPYGISSVCDDDQGTRFFLGQL